MEPNIDKVMVKKVPLGFDEVVSRSKYTYVIYNSIGESSPYFPCQMAGVGPVFGLKPAAFALQKNSPLLELFNYALLRLKENGLFDKIVRRWTTARILPDCDWEGDSRLGLEPTFGIFLILLLGIGCSSGLLLGEFLGKAFKKSKTPKTPDLAKSIENDIQRSFVTISLLIKQNHTNLTKDQKALLVKQLKSTM